MPPPDPLPRPGARIVLRRLATGDVRAFQAYRTDPEVGRWQGWSATTDAQALAFLAQMACEPLFVPGRWTQIGIALQAACPGANGEAGTPGHLVGDIGLVLHGDDPACAEIGFTLNAAWQRRGLASEAVALARDLVFEQTGARQVHALVDTRNDASIRLLERLAFERTETVDAVFRGEPCQEHRYVSVRR